MLFLNSSNRELRISQFHAAGVPNCIRIFGPLIAWPNLRNYRTFAKHVEPLIERKISRIQFSQRPGTQAENKLPRTVCFYPSYSLWVNNLTINAKDDILEWHIEYAKTQPGEFSTDMISRRLMLVNVAAVIAPTAALTHLVYDLYSMPGIGEFVKELRAEIQQALEEERGDWNMRLLNKLVKMDSAIKESMRVSAFSTRACARKASYSSHCIFCKSFQNPQHDSILTFKWANVLCSAQVLARGGYTLENGLFVPYGSTLSVPQWALHHDPTIYSDPDTYRPLRFYNQKPDPHQEQDTRSLVAATPEYLSWGLGRHAW